METVEVTNLWFHYVQSISHHSREDTHPNKLNKLLNKIQQRWSIQRHHRSFMSPFMKKRKRDESSICYCLLITSLTLHYTTLYLPLPPFLLSSPLRLSSPLKRVSDLPPQSILLTRVSEPPWWIGVCVVCIVCVCVSSWWISVCVMCVCMHVCLCLCVWSW